jgi:hypothetical protein
MLSDYGTIEMAYPKSRHKEQDDADFKRISGNRIFLWIKGEHTVKQITWNNADNSDEWEYVKQLVAPQIGDLGRK